MTAAPWWTWIAQVSGWALAGIGLLVLLRAMLWDRSRGRRRCPKCWYDMRGLSAAAIERGRDVYVCPECGRRMRGERRLHRTRRHWRMALLAAPILFLAYAALVAERMARFGTVGAVPDVALALFSPWLDPGDPVSASVAAMMRSMGIAPAAKPPTTWDGRCTEELWRRLQEGECNLVARWLLFGWPTCRATWFDPSDGPGAGVLSDDWLAKGLVHDVVPDRLQRWLWTATARRAIESRADWPADVPVSVRVSTPGWFVGRGLRVGLESEAMFRWGSRGSGWSSTEWCELGRAFALGEQPVLTFGVDGSDRVRTYFACTVQLPSIRHKSLDDVVTPFEDPEIAGLLGSGIYVDSTIYRHSPHSLVFDCTSAMAALPSDVGLGLRIEFLRDGAVQFASKLAACSSGDPRAVILSDIREWRREHPTSHYAIRVSTSPEMVMRELDYSRYWRGEALFELDADGKARPVSGPQPRSGEGAP